MHARRSVRRAGALLALLVACARAPFDLAALEAQHPELEALPGHRLADLHPYLLPRAGQLWLFTCRWSVDAPLGVSLAADLSEAERRGVEAALRAWQQAGLGLRFEPVAPDEAQLSIAMAEQPLERAAGPGAGVAVVDCGLAADAPDADADVLRAELVAARLTLVRNDGPDPLGRLRPLTPAELTGAAVHEIGHALGFQGHTRDHASSAMQRTPAALRRLGERVLAGEPFEDTSLRALYALPSGRVLARVPLEAWRTSTLDRMAALARENALEGPFARVGDSAARVFWRAPGGEEYGLQVVNLRESLRDPRRVIVVPEVATRHALPRSRDPRPEP